MSSADLNELDSKKNKKNGTVPDDDDDDSSTNTLAKLPKFIVYVFVIFIVVFLYISFGSSYVLMMVRIAAAISTDTDKFEFILKKDYNNTSLTTGEPVPKIDHDVQIDGSVVGGVRIKSADGVPRNTISFMLNDKQRGATGMFSKYFYSIISDMFNWSQWTTLTFFSMFDFFNNRFLVLFGGIILAVFCAILGILEFVFIFVSSIINLPYFYKSFTPTTGPDGGVEINDAEILMSSILWKLIITLPMFFIWIITIIVFMIVFGIAAHIPFLYIILLPYIFKIGGELSNKMQGSKSKSPEHGRDDIVKIWNVFKLILDVYPDMVFVIIFVLITALTSKVFGKLYFLIPLGFSVGTLWKLYTSSKTPASESAPAQKSTSEQSGGASSFSVKQFAKNKRAMKSVAKMAR